MTVRIEDLRQEGKKNGMTTFRSGQTVRVHRKIREGDKERIQIFEGLIIEVKNQRSVSATITVRKIIGGIGVEQVFQVHSPLIEKIELVKEAKVRRGKLYFMRNLRGKAARLKERFFTDAELKEMQPHELTESEVEEAIEHEKEEEAKKEEAEESAAPIEKEEEKAEAAKTEEASAEKPEVEENKKEDQK
jgi:large subunit ribosomal protein L19